MRRKDRLKQDARYIKQAAGTTEMNRQQFVDSVVRVAEALEHVIEHAKGGGECIEHADVWLNQEGRL